MGQKINPLGFRIGITEPHRSTWIARGESYGDLVAEDHEIRTFIKRRFRSAAVEKIIIERKADRVTLILTAAGVIIGKRGAEIDFVTKHLEKVTGKRVR